MNPGSMPLFDKVMKLGNIVSQFLKFRRPEGKLWGFVLVAWEIDEEETGEKNFSYASSIPRDQVIGLLEEQIAELKQIIMEEGKGETLQ